MLVFWMLSVHASTLNLTLKQLLVSCAVKIDLKNVCNKKCKSDEKPKQTSSRGQHIVIIFQRHFKNFEK